MCLAFGTCGSYAAKQPRAARVAGGDAVIDELAPAGFAYVPFFPLGGITPLQAAVLADFAKALQATPMQVALAWLLQREPSILPIPCTPSELAISMKTWGSVPNVQQIRRQPLAGLKWSWQAW